MQLRKLLYFLCTLLIISILLTGCNYAINNTISIKKKPNNFYYTDILSKSMAAEPSYKCTVLNINLSRQKKLDDKNTAIITSMIKSLNTKNFIPKPENLNTKPLYKIFFTFDKNKLVMNVYNERYLSVYPWDGNYPMDYIDVNGISISLNIYNLCNYIFENNNLK